MRRRQRRDSAFGRNNAAVSLLTRQARREAVRVVRRCCLRSFSVSLPSSAPGAVQDTFAGAAAYRRGSVEGFLQQRTEAAHAIVVLAEHVEQGEQAVAPGVVPEARVAPGDLEQLLHGAFDVVVHHLDRKSIRLNSSHVKISY